MRTVAFFSFNRRANSPTGCNTPVSLFAIMTDTNKVSDWIAGRQAGLTWNETLDLGAFLPVREWREASQPSPSLIWAGLALLDSVLPSGRRRLLKHLNQALAFVKNTNPKSRRATIGNADWWK